MKTPPASMDEVLANLATSLAITVAALNAAFRGSAQHHASR
ncbi:MAG: hypothetical protein AB7U95_15640 [Reyranella sp.]